MCRKMIPLVSFILVLGFIMDSAKADLTEDLVAYWTFDDGSGTIAIDVVGGHNGTLINGPVWTPPGDFKMGTGALQFDGIDDVVSIQPFDVIGGGITLAAWMKPDSFSINDGRVISKANEWLADDHWWMLSTIASGGEMRLRFRLKTNDGQPVPTLIATSGNLLVGEWHHWTATWDGTTMRLYSNTVEAGSTPKGGTAVAVDPTIGVAIGSQPPDAYASDPARVVKYFHGVIDDVAVWNRALTPEELNTLWNDGAGTPVVKLETAANPSPANEATDVPRDVVMSWTQGEFANTHDVYLGTVFEDVNDADRNNSLDVLLSQGQDANTYDPTSHLEFAQTYYWRIDEVNAPPDSTVYKGDIWSFTSEPIGYSIPGDRIVATASSTEATKRPENTVDGSGLDESGLLHSSIGGGNMWLSSRNGQQPTWIQYEFDQIYKLHQMLVWNSNEALEPVIGLGFRDVTIEYSLDGTDYTTLGTTHEFARASGQNNYAHNTTVDFGGVAVKFVRLTANSNWGGILEQYGLSEVRFLQIPVQAREPSPASGATDIALEPTLGWRAGREAAEHNVSFSDDEQAVIDGTADVTTVTDTSYGPLSLEIGKTYYWRVDEVNNAETLSTWPGEVWDFTTFEYFVVDDFEDYNDFEPDRIFDTWTDGWGITTNGSTIGYESPSFPDGEHFVETAIVNSGSQSMPYFFDNTTAGNSEATLTLSTLRNWAEKGIGSLTLWFRGNASGLVEDPAGTYTINASGADIWETADEFRYVYKQLSGDGSIIARVESVEDTDPWAKAGVMIRENFDPGSKFAAVYITPGNGSRFQARLTAAVDATSDTDVATSEQIAITAPYWVKIERTGNNFNGYYSSDGVNWVSISWNPQNTAMPADVFIGLAVTSHNAGETCTAVFSDVQTTGTVSPQVWTQEAIGVDMPNNDTAVMYVVLDDSAVVYLDNPNAALTDEWTEWSIELQEFADQGVNLTDVDTLGIGFGDRDNPQSGGSGVVYFDDIRLYPPQAP